MSNRLVLSFAPFLTAVLFAGASVAQSSTAPREPELAPSVRFEGGSAFAFSTDNPGRLPLVKATVNGVEGVFILDTGASVTVLSTAFADKAGLADRISQPGARVNGKGDGVKFAGIRELRVGEARFGAFDALLLDMAAFKSGLGVEPAGILGANVLMSAPLTLDYVKGAGRWNGAPPAGALSLPCSFTPSGVFLKAGLDGANLALLVDTGSSVNSILEKDWTGSRRRSGEQVSVRAESAGREARVFAEVRVASFGTLKVERPDFQLSTTHRCVGAPFLARRTLHLDAQRELVFLTPEAPVASR